MSRSSRSPSKKRKREEDSSDSFEDSRLLKRPRFITDKRQLINPFVNQGKTSKTVCLFAAGAGDFGQLGRMMEDEEGESEAPLIIKELQDLNCLDIVCGSQFTIVIEASKLEQFRHVWSWGQNDEGSLGRVADDEESVIPAFLPELHRKITIQASAGECHGAILDKEGLVYTWGIYKAAEGFLGFKPDRPKDEFQEVPELMDELTEHRIVQVASASSRTLALTETGEVFEWGFTRMTDKILTRHSKNRLLPAQVLISEKIEALFTANESIYALSNKGTVFAWGNNRYHQLGIELESAVKKEKANKTKKRGRKKRGVNYEETITRPHLCVGLNKAIEDEDVKKIVGGENHVIIWTESGKLFGIGNSKDGQLGTGDEKEYHYPILLDNFNDIDGEIVDVVCGERSTLVLFKSGDVYGTGYNPSGHMGRTSDDIVTEPVRLRYGKKFEAEWKIKKIECGSDFTVLGCEKRDK